jgi:hypothetical protein
MRRKPQNPRRVQPVPAVPAIRPGTGDRSIDSQLPPCPECGGDLILFIGDNEREIVCIECTGFFPSERN